jgi:hypothetical protein
LFMNSLCSCSSTLSVLQLCCVTIISAIAHVVSFLNRYTCHVCSQMCHKICKYLFQNACVPWVCIIWKFSTIEKCCNFFHNQMFRRAIIL